MAHPAHYLALTADVAQLLAKLRAALRHECAVEAAMRGQRGYRPEYIEETNQRCNALHEAAKHLSDCHNELLKQRL